MEHGVERGNTTHIRSEGRTVGETCARHAVCYTRGGGARAPERAV